MVSTLDFHFDDRGSNPCGSGSSLEEAGEAGEGGGQGNLAKVTELSEGGGSRNDGRSDRSGI